MADKRLSVPSKTKMRNLRQYKNMTDEEFDDYWGKHIVGVSTSQAFEDRIAHRIESFGEDYDLDDLKANDLLTLRALAQAYITLEDYENMFYNLRESEGINMNAILELEKLGNAMSKIRSDISAMQNDLGITRKLRKTDQELSLQSDLDIIHKKAKEFYEHKMFYYICQKCNMLLATAWYLYPNEPRNKMQLICNRVIDKDTGEICGEKLIISSADMLKLKGNNSEIVPEFFK